MPGLIGNPENNHERMVDHFTIQALKYKKRPGGETGPFT